MSGLVRRFRIDEFLVDPGNALAVAAVEGFAAEFPASRSPLVLYGPAGMGKTHLLHALGNAVAARLPDAPIHLVAPGAPVPASGPGPALILVDDLGADHAPWLARAAANPTDRWVWTAGRDPRKWPGLDEATRAWLEEGRVVDLAPPSIEVLEALADRWLARRGGALDPGTRAFVLDHFGASPGRLLAALERLWAEQALGAPHEAIGALSAFIEPPEPA